MNSCSTKGYKVSIKEKNMVRKDTGMPLHCEESKEIAHSYLHSKAKMHLQCVLLPDMSLLNLFFRSNGSQAAVFFTAGLFSSGSVPPQLQGHRFWFRADAYRLTGDMGRRNLCLPGKDPGDTAVRRNEQLHVLWLLWMCSSVFSSSPCF